MQPHEWKKGASTRLLELWSSSAGLRVDSPWISSRRPWRADRVEKPWNTRPWDIPPLFHTNPPPAHTTPGIAEYVGSSFQQ